MHCRKLPCHSESSAVLLKYLLVCVSNEQKCRRIPGPRPPFPLPPKGLVQMADLPASFQHFIAQTKAGGPRRGAVYLRCRVGREEWGQGEKAAAAGHSGLCERQIKEAGRALTAILGTHRLHQKVPYREDTAWRSTAQTGRCLCKAGRRTACSGHDPALKPLHHLPFVGS